MTQRFTTGKTFATGEQVTAQDLENIVELATPKTALTDDQTLTVNNGQIIVKDGSSADGVSFQKMKHIAARSVICNNTNSTTTPTNVVLAANRVLRCNSGGSALETVSGGISIDADSGTTHEILLGEELDVVGGEGIDTTISNNTLTIAGEIATTANKGVASFNTNDFSVSSGAVSIKTGGVSNTQLDNSSITVTAGTGLSGGGTIALGGSTTLNLDIPADSITPDKTSFIEHSAGELTLTGSSPKILFDDTGLNVTPPQIFGGSSAGNLNLKADESGAEVILTTNGVSRLSAGEDVATNAGGTTLQSGVKIFNDLYATGDVSADGDVAASVSSDIRLKEDIKPIQDALGKVNKLSGNTFKWKDCATYNGDDVGVIAQEVQEIVPSAVKERYDGYLKVDYTRLVPLLLESIKELSAKVQELESKSHTHGIK